MADQTLMSRVRGWFSRSDAQSGELSPLPHEGHDASHPESANRVSIFRPFARQNAALQSLHEGFVTLTDLMVGIRENLERQGARQDQLLEHLSRLPTLLEQLPESARMQGETLKALHQELAAQHLQQQKLTEILDHVSKSNSNQREVLESVSERMDRMRQTDEQIASNPSSVGSTMQEMGRQSSTGAQILESMRDNIAKRDTELQDVLTKQSTRFTVMLSIAIFLSIAALAAVAVIGWLLLNKPH